MAAPIVNSVLPVPALADRPIKNTVVLFDVDGTLTPARLVCTNFPEDHWEQLTDRNASNSLFPQR